MPDYQLSIVNCQLESAFDDFPVDDFPQAVQMVGAAVLKVDVVGMFPDVEGE